MNESGPGLLLPSHMLCAFLENLAAVNSTKRNSYRVALKMGFMARLSENGDGDDDEVGEADGDGA